MNRLPYRIAAILAATAAAALGVQIEMSPTTLTFPFTRGDTRIHVAKLVDTETGLVHTVSSDPAISRPADIDTLVANERREIRRRYGAMGKRLRGGFDAMAEGDSADVLVLLKMPPVEWLDKTTTPVEQLRAQSEAACALEPLVSVAQFSLDHQLDGQTLGRNMLAVRGPKAKLEAIAFDDAVAMVEQVSEDVPCSTPFAALAQSAFNPAPLPGPGGAGVRAATFENGLSSQHVSCRGNLNSNQLCIVSSPPAHSQQTFLCLRNAAPAASLYHRCGLAYYSTEAQQYLIDNAIQTVSLSYSRGGQSALSCTYFEFLIMDDFAYRYPYPVFCNPAGNAGYQYQANWQCYNAICVGNVKHENGTHYALSGWTQTTNPPARYGGSNDREMPSLVAPGHMPSPGSWYDQCLGTWADSGTSYSAPTVNGIAASLISASSIFISWPERVRVALLATAHNVDGGEWNASVDGRDGAGVISGSDAIAYAGNVTLTTPGGTACEHGIWSNAWYNTDTASKSFNIRIPSSKPAGKHLRVVLTWDSSPDINAGTNELSDLDLLAFQSDSRFYISTSWNGNIEIIDVPSSELTPAATYSFTVDPYVLRVPAGARVPYFYCAVGWTWVKDHAD